MARINRGKRQIATFGNRVKSLVPTFRQIIPDRESITVTRKSVELGTYAPYSDIVSKEGMFIQKHSIEDGHYDAGNWEEYRNNQLVALADLNYRLLVPNGTDPNSPTYNEKLDTNTGCVDLSHSSETIYYGGDWFGELTPRTGYSKVPAGRLEKQTGEDSWETIQTWNRVSSVNLNVNEVNTNLRIVFTEDCVYELTILKRIGGSNVGNPVVEEHTCSDSINVDSLHTQFDEEGLVYSGVKDINGQTVTGTKTFCENTTLYVDYTVNGYVVDTQNVNATCVNILSPSSAQHGESINIILTPKTGYDSIGAGSIKMGNAVIKSWESGQSRIEYTIDNVTANITVSADCPDIVRYPVTLIWYDTENNILISSMLLKIDGEDIAEGTSINANDYVNYYDVPREYPNYEIKGTTCVPDADDLEHIVITGQTSITYSYGLKTPTPTLTYTVRFLGSHVTFTGDTEQTEINAGDSASISYTIDDGYEFSHISPYPLNQQYTNVNGVITVSNVLSDVTITVVTREIEIRCPEEIYFKKNNNTITSDTIYVGDQVSYNVSYDIGDEVLILTLDITQGRNLITYDITDHTVNITANSVGNVILNAKLSASDSCERLEDNLTIEIKEPIVIDKRNANDCLPLCGTLDSNYFVIYDRGVDVTSQCTEIETELILVNQLPFEWSVSFKYNGDTYSDLRLPLCEYYKTTASDTINVTHISCSYFNEDDTGIYSVKPINDNESIYTVRVNYKNGTGQMKRYVLAAVDNENPGTSFYTYYRLEDGENLIDNYLSAIYNKAAQTVTLTLSKIRSDVQLDMKSGQKSECDNVIINYLDIGVTPNVNISDSITLSGTYEFGNSSNKNSYPEEIQQYFYETLQDGLYEYQFMDISGCVINIKYEKKSVKANVQLHVHSLNDSEGQYTSSGYKLVDVTPESNTFASIIASDSAFRDIYIPYSVTEKCELKTSSSSTPVIITGNAVFNGTSPISGTNVDYAENYYSIDIYLTEYEHLTELCSGYAQPNIILSEDGNGVNFNVTATEIKVYDVGDPKITYDVPVRYTSSVNQDRATVTIDNVSQDSLDDIESGNYDFSQFCSSLGTYNYAAKKVNGVWQIDTHQVCINEQCQDVPIIHNGIHSLP